MFLFRAWGKTNVVVNGGMLIDLQVVQVRGLDSMTVVCIAFSAFLIGVCLMGVLWYIHTKTGQSCRHAGSHVRSTGQAGTRGRSVRTNR